jgi:hypothetical protein
MKRYTIYVVVIGLVVAGCSHRYRNALHSGYGQTDFDRDWYECQRENTHPQSTAAVGGGPTAVYGQSQSVMVTDYPNGPGLHEGARLAARGLNRAWGSILGHTRARVWSAPTLRTTDGARTPAAIRTLRRLRWKPTRGERERRVREATLPACGVTISLFSSAKESAGKTKSASSPSLNRLGNEAEKGLDELSCKK